MEQNFSIIIPSHRPELANKTRECLKDFECVMHDGTGYPSFSKLINDSIMKASNEIVIIANDKVRPNSLHIKKMIFLLNKGFGFVGLFRFGFFGFHKDLIRSIGFFDERFIGGGHEDQDFGRRLVEANIAMYESPEAPYEHKQSTWNYKKAYEFYVKKWQETPTDWKRILPEEPLPYDIGEISSDLSKHWMPFNSSLLSHSSLPSHRQLKTFNGKPVDFSGLGCSEIF